MLSNAEVTALVVIIITIALILGFIFDRSSK